jgi:AraC family transcriptional regulator
MLWMLDYGAELPCGFGVVGKEANCYGAIAPRRKLHRQAGNRIYMLQIQPLEAKGARMETRIINLPAMRVIGMEYVGKNENAEIAAMWGVFVPRFGEVQGKICPDVKLGVCGDTQEDGSFRYVAGFQVDADAPEPDGMGAFDVPAATYVVVTQRGPLNDKERGLGAALNYVYQDWLPHSGYKRAATPDLEWYDERFRGDEEDSEMDVYTPIVPV